MVDNIPALLFSCSYQSVLLQANKALCEATGYAKEDLEGASLEKILGVAARIFFQTHLFPLLSVNKSIEEIYLSLRHRDGSDIPVLLNGCCLQENDGTVLQFVGLIVQNRKKFEQELLLAKKAAENAVKENKELQEAQASLSRQMKMLDDHMYLVSRQNLELKEFSRVITHELQEPVRKLSLFANMVQEGREINPDIIGKLGRSVSDMKEILRGLQQYVWLLETAGNRTEVSLEDIFRDALEKVNAAFPHVKAQVQTGSLPVLLANREQLVFLVEEIVSNAFRFRREEDAVDISVQAYTIMQNEFRAMRENYNYVEYHKIEFSDRGLGFDDAYRHKAFHLFETFHSKSGRGVGLALCRKIAEAHNGNISISRRRDGGTSVILLWPRASG